MKQFLLAMAIAAIAVTPSLGDQPSSIQTHLEEALLVPAFAFEPEYKYAMIDVTTSEDACTMQYVLVKDESTGLAWLTAPVTVDIAVGGTWMAAPSSLGMHQAVITCTSDLELHARIYEGPSKMQDVQVPKF